MATTTTDKVDEGKDFGVRRLMVWTAAREEKLLELWKSRRCLFDPNSLVTKAERQLALSEVAGELGIAGLSRTHVLTWRGQCVTAASLVMWDYRIGYSVTLRPNWRECRLISLLLTVLLNTRNLPPKCCCGNSFSRICMYRNVCLSACNTITFGSPDPGSSFSYADTLQEI